MPDTADLLLFLGATLALNVTPGPDMLFILARSVAEGRGAGLISALGIAAGCLFHTALVALGLYGLLSTYPAAFDVVRYVGAAYLIYLGLRALIGSKGKTEASTPLQAAPLAVFRQAAVTNILNPKVALFFLAFLPQFVDQSQGSVVLQILTLGLLFSLCGLLINLVVALIASQAGDWSRRRAGESVLFRGLTGVVFVGLGLRLLLVESG